MGYLLCDRRHEPGEHGLQHPERVDEDLHLLDRLRGEPGQEPAEDQHVAPVGRDDPHLRGHWQTDALLRQEDTTT